MQIRFTTIAIVIFSVLSSFHPAPGDSISIRVTNLRSNKGEVLVSLFNSPDGFPSRPEKAFRIARVDIRDQEAILQFEHIPAGSYAIAVLHDENGDRKMNINRLGLPREGFGFSQNPAIIFGAPSFKKASFQHRAGLATSMQIRARY